MSNTSTTRTIYLKVPPKDGNPSVGLTYTPNKISYYKSEAYETDVIVQVNEGGVLVEPSYVKGQLAFSTAPGTFHNIVLNQYYSGMRVTSISVGTTSVFHFSFIKGASFKGQIKFSVRHKGMDYIVLVDVSYYTENVTMECTMNSLTYNPSKETHSMLFDAYLTIDGLKVTDYDLSANWQTKDGDDVIFTPAVIGAASFFRGLSIDRYRDEMLMLTIQKGAAFEGALEITLTKGDVARSALITIARVEDGRPGDNGTSASYVDYNLAALTYKEGESLTTQFTAELVVEGEEVDPRFTVRDGYLEDNDGRQITIGSSSYLGAFVKYYEDEGCYTAIFSDTATFEGSLFLTLSHNGVRKTVQIPILRMPKGEPGRNAITLEASCNTIVYNKFKGYEKLISLMINEGGHATHAQLQTVKFNGQIVPSEGLETDDFSISYSQPQYNTILGAYAPAMLRVDIYSEAEVEGTIEVQTPRPNGGDPLRTEISVTCVEDGGDGKDGKDASYIDCGITALAYKEGEESLATFTATLYVDGVKQEMSDVTSDIWVIPNEDDPVQMGGLTPHCQGLWVAQSEDFFFAHFNDTAEFEGMVLITLSKGRVSRSIQIPVMRIPKGEPGKNGISLETSCDSFTYNNSKAHSRVISFAIDDGGEPIDIILDSIKFNGENVPLYGDYEKDGMTLHYTQAIVNPQTGLIKPAVLNLHFEPGATADGTIEVSETYKGILYKAEISVTCVENGEDGKDGEDAISLVCTTNAITYNPVIPKSVTISVIVMEGRNRREPEFSNAVFKQNGEIRSTNLENGQSLRGMTFTEAANGGRHQITLSFAQDAYADGELVLGYLYDGMFFEAEISITKVENGIRGFNGASPRGPRIWSEVKAAHSDPDDTEQFFCGKDGEEWQDIVLVIGEGADGEPNEVFYTPLQTHYVKDSPEPTDVDHGAAQYWKMLSDYESVATKLLLAKRAKIENLVAEGIEMNEDVGGQRKVVFSASKYEENGQTKAVVYASKGKFENVEVIGDIQCNTQTFTTPEFPSHDIHMWETNFHPRKLSDIIQIIPQGGCIIAPTGKCSYEVMLPPIPANTARQLMIINQKMPYTLGSELSSRNRNIYLTPGGSRVRVFADMESEESSSIPEQFEPNNPQPAESVILGYGAFMVFGYTAIEPWVDNNVYYTYWSVWKMSQGGSEIRMEFQEFPSKNPYEIPVFNDSHDILEPTPLG